MMKYCTCLSMSDDDFMSKYGSLIDTDTDCSAYIEALYNMAADLQKVYGELGQAYLAIAELQQFVALGSEGYTPYESIEELAAASADELEAQGISITALATFVQDCEILDECVDELYVYCKAYQNEMAQVPVEDIIDVINEMIDVPNSTVAGMTFSDVDMITLFLLLYNGNSPTIIINSGLIYRLETQLQSKMQVVVQTDITAVFELTISFGVCTSADTMTAWTDYTSAAGVTSFAGTDAVANETYAMAVDLWVRTNAAGTYLTLEGEIQTDEETGQVTGYAGSNRVWEDYELTTNGAATTQGMGSCYVFTCDDPVEALRITELLDAMTVAFVDADGALLGYADLDTDHIWQDYGRYVVPLTVRSTGSNYVTGTDEDGEETTTYYITSLAQNQAQRITAILYLDGTRLTNEQASAAQDIEGQLNIQFGTTGSLTPADNEALYNETIFLDSISPAETTLAYTGDAQSVTLTAQLSGDGVSADSAVTGYFLRAINSSQGVPQETLTFTYADGAWTAQADFTEPGEYVLTRLTVDGVSYSLSDLSNEAYTAVGVTVEGYALAAVSLDEDELFSTGGSASTGVTLTVTDTTGAVESVSALFLSADGKTVRAEMTCANGRWTGTAAFSTSGTYTLSYVYLNGDAYAVSDDLQKTVAVTLGVGARVWIMAADGTSFADGESATYFTIPDEGMKLTARVELTDNAGSALEGLDNAMTLHYLSAVGGIELDTDLTWNASTGYYEGDINVTLGGIYSFSSITLDSNTISRVTYAPTITAVATGEPEYYGDNTAASQMVLTSTAYLSLDILNGDTEGLTVSAVVLDEKTEESYTVEGTLETTYLTSAAESVSTYTFAVPTDQEGATQDGYYSVTSLTLSGYTNEDGETAETTVPLSDVQTKVVSTVYASVDYSGDTDLTETLEGEFMEDVLVDGFSLTLVDYEGQALPQGAVSAAALVYGYYNCDSSSNMSIAPTSYPSEFSTDMAWGRTYSKSRLTIKQNDSSSPAMTADGTQTGSSTWIFDALNFRVAGTYYGTVDFTVDGMDFLMTSITSAAGSAYLLDGATTVYAAENVKVKGNDLAHSVVRTWTTLPELTIKSTTPEQGEVFTVNYAYNGIETVNLYNTWNYISSDYSAYVFIKAEENADGSLSYTLPSVTFELTGIDKYDSVQLYKSYNTAAYDTVFGSGEAITAEIGTFSSSGLAQTSSMTIKGLNMSYDGMTCYVALDQSVSAYEYYSPAKTLSFYLPDTSAPVSSAVTLDEAYAQAIGDAMEEAGLLSRVEQVSPYDEDGNVVNPYSTSLVIEDGLPALEFKVADTENTDSSTWISENTETQSYNWVTVTKSASGYVYDTDGSVLYRDGEQVYTHWRLKLYNSSFEETTETVTKPTGTASFQVTKWGFLTMTSNYKGVSWGSSVTTTSTAEKTTTLSGTSNYVYKAAPYNWTQTDFVADGGSTSYDHFVRTSNSQTQIKVSDEYFTELLEELDGTTVYQDTANTTYAVIYVDMELTQSELTEYLLETYGIHYGTYSSTETYTEITD
ncbi:MAG: hypothetical protein LUE91_01320 [Oscillospiraceae bacterium]|nr:hypothetical protein [Oscillospiraceae bacterium]